MAGTEARLPHARQLRLLGVLNFLTDLRFYAPIAVLFYRQVAGSFAAGMAVFSVASLAAVVAELPAGLSPLMGLMADARGPVAALLASQAVMLVPLAIDFTLYRKERKKESKE